MFISALILEAVTIAVDIPTNIDISIAAATGRVKVIEFTGEKKPVMTAISPAAWPISAMLAAMPGNLYFTISTIIAATKSTPADIISVSITLSPIVGVNAS